MIVQFDIFITQFFDINLSDINDPHFFRLLCLLVFLLFFGIFFFL